MSLGKTKIWIALLAVLASHSQSYARGTGEVVDIVDEEPPACDPEFAAHGEARRRMHASLSRYYDTLAKQLYPAEYNELMKEMGPEFRRTMTIADFTPAPYRLTRPLFNKYDQIFDAGDNAMFVRSLIQEGIPFMAIKLPIGLTLAMFSIPHYVTKGGVPQNYGELDRRITAEKDALYKKAEEKLNFLFQSMDIPQRIALRPGMSQQEIEKLFISRNGHMKLASQDGPEDKKVQLKNDLNQLTSTLHVYLQKDHALDICLNKNRRNSHGLIVEANSKLAPAVHSVLREGKSPFTFETFRYGTGEVTQESNPQDVMVGGLGR